MQTSKFIVSVVISYSHLEDFNGIDVFQFELLRVLEGVEGSFEEEDGAVPFVESVRKAPNFEIAGEAGAIDRTETGQRQFQSDFAWEAREIRWKGHSEFAAISGEFEGLRSV